MINSDSVGSLYKRREKKLRKIVNLIDNSSVKILINFIKERFNKLLILKYNPSFNISGEEGWVHRM